MSLTNFQKIIEFHKTSGLVVNTIPQLNVTRKYPDLVKLRTSLIVEEANELIDAVEANDFKEVIDALMDLLYVTYGTCTSFGIDANKVFIFCNKVKLVIQTNVITENPNLVSLRLSEIQTSIQTFLTAVNEQNFEAIKNALFEILRSTYQASISFGIDPNVGFGLVHESNMTKFCDTEELAKQTVESYKNDDRYDTPAYRKTETGLYVVYNESTGKILKSNDYKPVTFDSMYPPKKEVAEIVEISKETNDMVIGC